MLAFAKGGMIPPGGVFFYADPVNGVPLLQEPTSFTALVSRVRSAYLSAGKPAPEPLASTVEAYICEHVPRGFCIGSYTGNPPDFMTPQAVKERSRDAAARCARADPGTVKARAPICGGCVDNSKALCLSCTGLTDWAVKMAGRTKMGIDDSLGICRHDRILVSLLVSLNGPAPKPDGRPDNCWRLKNVN